jgi:PST family polysaccharide transporter
VVIKLAAARGAAWNLSMGVAVRAIGLLGTLVLTKFLSPGQYGEVSLAVVSAFMASRLANFSLGPFVIAQKSGPEEVFQAHVLHVGAVTTAAAVLFAVRDRLGAFLGSPRMADYIPGIVVAAVVTSLSQIPGAVLVRALRFRFVAAARAIAEVGATLTSVALVPFWGAFAVVAGALVRAVATTTLLLARAPAAEWFRPVFPRGETIRRMLGFGVPLSAGGFADSLATYGDNLLVSRLFGPPVMAQYNLAYNLADTPTAHVAEHIFDVLLPSFAKLDLEQRRRALARVSGLMALVIYPLALGLAAVAPTVVAAVLDPRWAGVAPLLAILAALSLSRPVVWVVSTYLTAASRTTALMYLGVFKAFAVFAMILTLGRAGPLWVCAGVVIAFASLAPAYLIVGRALTGLPAGLILGSVVPPFLASVVMGIGVVAFRSAAVAWGFSPSLLRLALEIGVGALVYAAAAPLVARSATAELLALLREMRAGAPRA